MIELDDLTLAQVRLHAQDDYPRESCGLVVIERGRQVYLRCRNLAQGTEHFIIDPADYAAAEDRGAVALVVHSHPNLPPTPSQPDMVGCEASGLPWLIVSWPTGAVHQFAPTGYQAPLTGRVFAHGLLDCYSLIRDYYWLTLGIQLPDFPRVDDWWHKGQNLYMEGFESAGFVRVDGEPRLHDGLLMQMRSPVPNHGAVYVGDGYVLQHLVGRLSSRDVYGGWLQKHHTHTLRHRRLL